MRIEILVGSENPVFYFMNKPKLVIGSDISADIVVSEDQISRKHLVVQSEGDQIFVIDQGSTNGSYLNEERLVPGRKTEFTSYFPVRLGSSVLVSLVSDEDAEQADSLSIPFESSAPKKSPLSSQNRAGSDRTTVISLKDLQESRTDSLVKKRDTYKKKVAENAGKVSAPGKKKKKKSSLQPIHFVVLAILAPALYFTFGDKEAQTPVGKIDGVSNSQGKIAKTVPVVKKIEMPTFLEVATLLAEGSKCVSPDEKLLCASFVSANELPWGAATLKENVVVMINATAIYEKIKAELPPQIPVSSEVEKGTLPEGQIESVAPNPELSPEQQDIYQAELWELTVGMFLLDGITDESYLKLSNKNLVIGFFLLNEGLPALKSTIALTPQDLQRVRILLSNRKFDNLKLARANIMSFRKEFYELMLE